MNRTHSVFALKCSAVALALAFQGVALAAQPSASASPAHVAAANGAPAPHCGHRMSHHHPAMLIPGYGPVGQKVLAALKLDASQTQLLESARTAQKDFHQARRESMKQAWQARAGQLAAGKIDPRQALAQRQSAFRAAGDQRTQVEQKWLALWDALNPGQQQQVAAAFQKRQQRHAQHHGSLD